MRVVIVGAGSAIPYMEMAQTCILVEERGCKILVDAGIGAYLKLAQIGFDLSEIKAILLTHNHLDHNGDVLAILKARWLSGVKEELLIHGPAGTSNHFESLLEAYPYLRRKLSFRILEGEREIEIEDFKIRTIPTKHSVESNGYMIDEKLIISGDTSPVKEIFEKRCKLLIHELSLPFGFESDDHTTPESIVELLRDAKAEKIVFIHLYPQVYGMLDRVMKYLKEYNQNITVAKDGDVFEV
jgi:ribonuclease BN (tRNA processing enzyme)